MNLVINAAEAIQGEGAVTVTTTICSAEDLDQAQFLADHDLEGSYYASP